MKIDIYIYIFFWYLDFFKLFISISVFLDCRQVSQDTLQILQV